MDHRPDPEPPSRPVSGAYAFGRLQQAIETSGTHPDPEIRRRAGAKALAWEAVLDGMGDGSLAIGSRTPVAGVPAWVTLEVAEGGFATGRLLAETPLDDDERPVLSRLPARPAGVEPRLHLNLWHLGDDGLAHLEQVLADGTYAVDLPEHGALLVVAWLVSRGDVVAALDLVAELHPWMHRLRLTPRLLETPATSAAVVHLASVGEVAADLRRIRTPPQVEAMNTALSVWRPLADDLVALWSETVADGWPCQRWPADWPARREDLLARFDAAVAEHGVPRRFGPKGSSGILLDALDRCRHDSADLTGRDVGRIRRALDDSIARWGAPGSPEGATRRARQAAVAARPTNARLAAVVADRLAPGPATGGLADPASVLGPIEVDAATYDPPASVRRRVERTREGTVAELVESGTIPSAEVLARVLPQVAAPIVAADLADAELRSLYAAVDAAFRRRRSLLLLDLAHQVEVDELPWVAALAAHRTSTTDTRAGATAALREATLLTLGSFPQTILPNPLIRELAALARRAELDIPFVEELAADIFMGRFSPKWTVAAEQALGLVEGTLYARYYDLPPRLDDDLAAVCTRRAAEAAAGDGSWVARNGTVVEQAQILTTHNLAALVDRLDLAPDLRRRAPDLAAAALAFAVHELTVPRPTWPSRLRAVKNVAYAWRQAVFLLSFVPPDAQAAAVDDVRAAVAATPPAARLGAAIDGLDAVVAGARFDDDGRIGDARRLLGWAVGPHWLLGAGGGERRPAG